MEHTGSFEAAAEHLRRFCTAEVRDGGLTTRYRTGGGGRPVVLLGETALPAETVQALAARCRLIIPEVPGEAERPGRAFSAWLRGFLDGLGLAEVALVAEPVQGVAALAFAMLDCERVTRVVLLVADGADPVAPAGVIRDGLAERAQPLLLVRLDEAAGQPTALASGELVRFLEGGAG
jgi:pimeloyl-ACP methyl ester carboxylesterase